MTNPARKLRLDPRRFLILLFPFIVIVVSFLLIVLYGQPESTPAETATISGHAEAVARLRMLATWLLLLVIGLGCIAYFVWNLKLFEPGTRTWLIGLFAGLALFGAVSMSGGLAEAPKLMGEGEICAALAAPPPPLQATSGRTASARSLGEFKGSVSLSAPSLEYPFKPARCENDHGRMALMWRLNLVQRVLLALVSPALVLGTIICLARPPRKSAEDCRERLGRLKTHLYLAAAVFVSGLLFLSALLRWPAIAFTPAGASTYMAHVDAFIVYWGVTYSLYIASYYIPVAMLLAQDFRDAGVAAKDLPTAQFGELAKTMLALFAPLLTALLGNVVQF